MFCWPLIAFYLSPVSRALNFLFAVNPALKCWAIVNRPLRGGEVEGSDLLTFPAKAVFGIFQNDSPFQKLISDFIGPLEVPPVSSLLTQGH